MEMKQQFLLTWMVLLVLVRAIFVRINDSRMKKWRKGLVILIVLLSTLFSAGESAYAEEITYNVTPDNRTAASLIFSGNDKQCIDAIEAPIKVPAHTEYLPSFRWNNRATLYCFFHDAVIYLYADDSKVAVWKSTPIDGNYFDLYNSGTYHVSMSNGVLCLDTPNPKNSYPPCP